MIPKIIALSTIILFFSSLLSLAQKKGGERFQLVYADSLKSRIIGEKTVRELMGRVKFVQGQMEMTCDRALQYVEEGRVVFEGHVVIKDGSRSLVADRVTYYQDQNLEIAEGKVKIVDQKKILTANKVTYYEDTKKALAQGKAKIVDLENHLTLTSERLDYDRFQDHGVATINPKLVKKDSTSSEEITIVSERMESFGEDRRILAYGGVVITRGKLIAKCEEAEYLDREEKVILRKQPVIFQGDTELNGKKIELYLKDLKLQKVHILEEALVTKKIRLDDTEKIDELSGEKMWIYVNDDLIEKIVVEERATSLYHMFENEEYQGKNQVSGDKITLFLSDGEIKRIKIESKPGSSRGKYYPSSYN